MKLNKNRKGGKPGHKSVKTASLLVLTAVFIFVVCGAASAADDNNTALNTTHSGTVSGGLYVNATQPVAWGNQPGQSSSTSSREFNQTFNLPTNSSLNGSDIQWAEVYVNIYSGTGSGNWPCNATILLDGNGDGVYETTLGTELLTSDHYSTKGDIYWINDHCFRVYSDYQLWYDVTGKITCTNPSIYVKTEQVGTDSYDGRLKMITLIAAYNDGDNDKVDYWVNDGQDWISSGNTSQTTFNTNTVTNNITNATLNIVALSSIDGTYTFNGTTYNGTNPVAPYNYFETHTWNVTNNITPGQNSTLNYTAGSGTFKNVLATLTLRETPAPVADFTATPTSGNSPLRVTFTNTSMGIIDTYAWDFNNDGTTDSTLPNPSYTYNNAGTYTVNLTVIGPGGTDTKTEYIGVIPDNYISAISTNYSSYFGGNSDENGQKIAIDSEGNIYVTGYAQSFDVLVSKFNSSGNLIYSNFIGGTNEDRGYDIAVDSAGNIYITGSTNSTDFPTTTDAYRTAGNGFVVKLDTNGTLIYSTYLESVGYGIAVNNEGNAYVTGSMFVYKLNPTGTALIYNTSVEGNALDIAVDNQGNAYVTGDIPGLTDGYDYVFGGNIHGTTLTKAFCSVLDSNGTLFFNHVFGAYDGYSNDYGKAITVDNHGNAYITGCSGSSAFIVEYNTDGTHVVTYSYEAENDDGDLEVFTTTSWVPLVYATKLAATDGHDIVIDDAGNLYITGYTSSSSLPNVTGSYQSTYGGGSSDVFVYKLNLSTGLVYTTFLGGSDVDYGNGIVVDSSGNAYITGSTKSINFPVTPGAYQTIYGGGNSDTFVMKLNLNPLEPPVANFTADITSGSAPMTVHFTDSSTGIVTSWKWDFNNDGIVDSISKNPTYTYTSPGIYTVKLTTSNNGGSDDEVKTDYLTIMTDLQAPTVTATPASGVITTATQVTLSATDDYDKNPTIYYTTNGTDPTTSSTVYSAPINISKTITLKFIAVDAAGNVSSVRTETYTDSQSPTVTASPPGGTNTSLIYVTLSATDNADPNPKIYITTDGKEPTTSSTEYSGSITIPKTTTLKFIAVDESGNISPVQSETYTVADSEVPTVTAKLDSGSYNLNSTVILSANDNVDPNPLIYYTTNGEDPTTSCTLYNGPICLPNYTNTTLKFIAVDASGNTSPVQSRTYTIKDIEAPTVTATQSGTTVTLSATDNSGLNSTIYYTTDGTDPKTSDTPYSGPFSIPQYATTVVKFIAVDANGNISSVQSKTFSTYTGNLYNGGRFSSGHDLVNTMVYKEGNIGVRIVQYGYYTWFTTSGTATYTASDLNLPEGATILSARLYQGWTWYGYPGFTVAFNGHKAQNPTVSYADCINGQDVFDVTSYFNATGDNTAVITAGRDQRGLYGTVLIVVYEAASEPYRQIWINEGSDCLLYDPATGYTIFNNVTTTGLVSAKITTVLESGDNNAQNTILFNNQYDSITGRGGSDPALKYYDVTNILQNGSNELGVSAEDYMNFSNAILEVTKDTTAPIVTANPTSGVSNTSQTVILTATDDYDTTPDIYYTLNGDTPTTSSTLYTGPLTIDTTTTFKFIAVDDVGNVSDVQSETYTIDTVMPTVSADTPGGSYNTSKTVTLTASDNLDIQPDIYYTLDGSTPTTTSTLYSGPISINNTTTLKFIAVDDAGNVSGVQSETYTIDTVSPGVSASIGTGVFGSGQNVALTVTDNLDTQPAIYYTLDGSTPTTTSTLYSGPISINNTTTLKFIAVDDAGNVSGVESRTYIVDTQAPIVTVNPAGGLYNTSENVTLTATDNITANPIIYYTLDGTDPTTSSNLYSGPISITANTTLQFIATDIFGNTSPVQSETYTIDTQAPAVAVDIHGGLFNTGKMVNLSATDNLDTNPGIYYTINGSMPTMSSILYTGPISINKTTTLKFLALDDAGNTSGVKSESYSVDMVKPFVTKIDPANSTFINYTRKVITVTFSEVVKRGAGLILLKNSKGTSISTKVAVYGNKLTITPVKLLGDGVYALQLFNGSVTDTAGNKITAYTSKFTVDTIKPVVKKIDPANNTTIKNRSKKITATFNETIKKGTGWIELRRNGTKISVKTVINGNKLTITPTKTLTNGTYQLILHTGSLTDKAGNKIALKITKFTVKT